MGSFVMSKAQCWLRKKQAVSVEQIVLQSSTMPTNHCGKWIFARSVCLPHTSCVQNVFSQNWLSVKLAATFTHTHTKQTDSSSILLGGTVATSSTGVKVSNLTSSPLAFSWLQQTALKTWKVIMNVTLLHIMFPTCAVIGFADVDSSKHNVANWARGWGFLSPAIPVTCIETCSMCLEITGWVHLWDNWRVNASDAQQPLKNMD